MYQYYSIVGLALLSIKQNLQTDSGKERIFYSDYSSRGFLRLHGSAAKTLICFCFCV